MRQRLLFYYCVVVTTALFAASLLITPRPQNVAMLILFAPVTYYFWLHAVKPANLFNQNPLKQLSTWIILITALVIFTSSLSIFLYKEQEARKTKTLPSEQENLQKQLDSIKLELEKNKELGEKLDNALEILKEIQTQKYVQDVVLGIEGTNSAKEAQ